eukprot:Colp12_sorted_trinity150504_noHs@6547
MKRLASAAFRQLLAPTKTQSKQDANVENELSSSATASTTEQHLKPTVINSTPVTSQDASRPVKKLKRENPIFVPKALRKASADSNTSPSASAPTDGLKVLGAAAGLAEEIDTPTAEDSTSAVQTSAPLKRKKPAVAVFVPRQKRKTETNSDSSTTSPAVESSPAITNTNESTAGSFTKPAAAAKAVKAKPATGIRMISLSGMITAATKANTNTATSSKITEVGGTTKPITSQTSKPAVVQKKATK